MQKGLIGKKIGMTQFFDEKGNVIPVTVLEVGPCAVVQKKTEEKFRFVLQTRDVSLKNRLQ